MTKTTVTMLNDDVGVLKHIQSMYSTDKIGYRLPISKLLLACTMYVAKKISSGKLKLSYTNGKVSIIETR